MEMTLSELKGYLLEDYIGVFNEFDFYEKQAKDKGLDTTILIEKMESINEWCVATMSAPSILVFQHMDSILEDKLIELYEEIDKIIDFVPESVCQEECPAKVKTASPLSMDAQSLVERLVLNLI